MLDFSGASPTTHPMLAILSQIRAHIRRVDRVMSRGMPNASEPVLAVCALFRDLLDHAGQQTGRDVPRLEVALGRVLDSGEYYSRHWICLPDGGLIDPSPTPDLPARLISAEEAHITYFEKKRVRVGIDPMLGSLLAGETVLPFAGAPDCATMREGIEALRRAACDVVSRQAAAPAPL